MLSTIFECFIGFDKLEASFGCVRTADFMSLLFNFSAVFDGLSFFSLKFSFKIINDILYFYQGGARFSIKLVANITKSYLLLLSANNNYVPY